MPLATLFQRISLGVAAFVLFIAVVVSAVVVARSIAALDEAFASVERPAEVSRTLVRLRLSLSDAESAQRGYLFTGERLYLAPYDGTRRAVDSLLTRLDTLVHVNPVQVARMPALRRSVREKQDEMNQTLALDAAGRRADAIVLVRTGRGARLMETIRTETDAMITEARRMRTVWTAEVRKARRNALWATAATNGLLLVLGLAGALMLRRLLRTRERFTEGLARTNGQLSQAVAEREAALVHVQSMQAQVVQQEKLAGLGRLTAGVAHELKNPLNFVNNFAALAEELAAEAQAAVDAGQADEVRALLADLRLNTSKIAEHGHRADEIVQTMLVHARGVSGDREPVDLADVLKTAAVQAAGPDDPRAVEITVSTEALGDARLVGIPSALGRMMLNLVENAVQAVRERAGFEAGFTPRVAVEAHVGRDRAGHDVAIITVSDNGAGISDTALPRIFEPFYTTKSPGQGTGLGLSLAYDIAVGHGGTLMAGRSDLGGALFTVTLPLVAEAAAA